MKQIIIILLIVTVAGCTGTKNTGDTVHKYRKFSTFGGDTVQYLTYNFEQNLSKYAGKKFKVLLRDLELPVKTTYYSTEGNTMNVCRGFTLSFIDPGERTRRAIEHRKIIFMDIEWETTFLTNELDKAAKGRVGVWSKDHIDFYKDRVIKSIKVSVYPDPPKKTVPVVPNKN